MEGFLKKNFNKICCALIMVLLSGCIFGCGKGDEEDSRNFVFSLEDKEPVEGIGSLTGFKLAKTRDEIVLYGSENQGGNNVAHFVYYDANGEVALYYICNLGPDHLDKVCVTEDGDVYALLWTKDRDEVPADDYDMPDEPVWDETDLEEDDLNIPEEADDEEVDEEKPLEEETSEDMSLEEENVDEDVDVDVDEVPSDEEISEPVDYGSFAPPQPEERTPENGYYFELCKIDKNGEVVIDKDIRDDEAVAEIDSIEDEYSIRNFVCDKEHIFIQTSDSVIAYDYALNCINVLPSKNLDSNLKYASYINSSSGELYASFNDSQYNVVVAKADLMKGTVEKGEKIPGAKYWATISTGMTKDFLYCNNGILFEFNAGDEELTKIMDFTASGVPTDNIYCAAGFDEKHFMANYRSINDGASYLGNFSKVNPEDVQEKIIIDLATMSDVELVRKAVYNFNQNNPEYSIRILNYEAMYSDGTGDMSTAINKLNTDIISGNMPDILLVDSSVPINTYISKNLIEDLNPFIENDPEFNRSDLNEHLLDIYSKEGKLYSLVPAYSVRTVMAKKENVGDNFSWTIDRAVQIYNDVDAKSFFVWRNQEDIIRSCIQMSGDRFINIEKAECNFNSDEFKEVLEFVKTCIPAQDVDYDFMVKQMGESDQWFRKNKVLCQMVNLSDMTDFAYQRSGTFFGEVALIGFPCDGGNAGSAYEPLLNLCLSSKSKDKDVCWKFMRYFLTDDFQMNDDVLAETFPLANRAYEEKMKRAQDPKRMGYSWRNDDGTENFWPMIYYVDGEEKNVEPLTDKEVEYIGRFLQSINKSSEVDEKIISIILEEAKEYFEDNATMDEVCKRIQSRAQIYIYECQ